MLADRPEMAIHLREGDRIWNWALRAFGGIEHGFPIYWDPEFPSSGSEAECCIPSDETPARIRLRPQRGSSPTDRFEIHWAAFVLEVNNLLGSRDYSEVLREAGERLMGRSEWIRRNVALEFEASRRARSFFLQVWQPWARERDLPCTPGEWYLEAPESLEGWVEWDARTPPSVAAYWAEYYDSYIGPYWQRRGDAGGPAGGERAGQGR